MFQAGRLTEESLAGIDDLYNRDQTVKVFQQTAQVPEGVIGEIWDQVSL